jgi:hypothetical protein
MVIPASSAKASDNEAKDDKQDKDGETEAKDSTGGGNWWQPAIFSN